MNRISHTQKIGHSLEEQKTGPRAPCSSVLREEEEATIFAFRRHTLLPLDDCLYALQPSVANLTRSAVHRCLRRHGIPRLPDVKGDKASMEAVTIIGFDLVKNMFQAHGAVTERSVLYRKKLPRPQAISFAASRD